VPSVPRTDGTGQGPLRCWIPDDILKIRRTDPALARRWRLGVREALGPAVSHGYQVTAVADPGWYVLRKPRARP
jgi:predicted GNAT superfamily acetyltransferase